MDKDAVILSHETEYVKTAESFKILLFGKEWDLSVHTLDGNVTGTCENNLMTSQLIFHNYSKKLRQKIFNQLKEYYEKPNLPTQL